MTILLTFIMVLQLIPIPAFATEEIATAEDLKAFLENPENVTVAEGSTLTVQISAENKLTKVSVFCDGEVRIKKDVTIPSAVKLQIPAATLYFHVGQYDYGFWLHSGWSCGCRQSQRHCR